MTKIRIFCIPYAGGSSAVYRKWGEYLGNNFELIPIELAGRGSRFGEKAYTKMEDIVKDIYNKIENLINVGEYMLFGHSMGALITYELIKKIILKGDNEPMHVFFSGKSAPHIEMNNKNLYKKSDDELIDEIISLGGTSEEILDDKELIDIFLPIIRADYEVIETYKYSGIREKFKFPITIFNGIYDKLTERKICEWRIYTCNKFEIYNFNGGHFFINNNVEEICKIIQQKANY